MSAAPLQGQDRHTDDTTERVESLKAEMDRLVPLVEAAREDLYGRFEREDDVDRVVFASLAAVDTFQVGLLSVIAPEGQSELAQEMFEEVWNAHFTDIDHSPALERARFVFQWLDVRVPIYTARGEPRVTVDSGSWVDREEVRARIRAQIATTLHHDLSDSYVIDGHRRSLAVGRWAPHNANLEQNWPWVYRNVALTRSIVSRDCMTGNIAACESALGLGVPPAEGRTTWAPIVVAGREWRQPYNQEQFERWYTAEERRLLVYEQSNLAAFGREERWRACVHEDAFDVCDGLLEDSYGEYVPFKGPIRTSLLAFALEQGGKGAWARVFENPTFSPTEALENASGLTIDELVTGWRARVLASQPPTYGSIFSSGALAVLWFSFFAALAMRSTRWRLG